MTSDADPKDSQRPDDNDRLARAFSLTERLMGGGGPGEAAPHAEPLKIAEKSLRYWLWRISGRRTGGPSGQVAENYERELARLAESLRSQGEKALARERARVAELETLTGQLRQVYDAELAKLREQLAERLERPAAPGEVERLSARCAEAEDRARLAENKVEMLKEALEITRARAGNAPCAPGSVADDRFREAKRAFARLFHPDRGGRDAPERGQVFLEFWPVLERIERGE